MVIHTAACAITVDASGPDVFSFARAWLKNDLFGFNLF